MLFGLIIEIMLNLLKKKLMILVGIFFKMILYNIDSDKKFIN